MQMQRAWEPLGERVSAQKGHAYTQIPGHTHGHFDTWAHSLILTHNQPFYSIPFRNPNFAFGSLRFGFAILKYWVRTFFFPSYAYMHSACRWLFFSHFISFFLFIVFMECLVSMPPHTYRYIGVRLTVCIESYTQWYTQHTNVLCGMSYFILHRKLNDSGCGWYVLWQTKCGLNGTIIFIVIIIIVIIVHTLLL